MFYDVIASARDWAIILLVLQAMVLFALPLFVFLKCVQGLRGFLPRVRPQLRQLHALVTRVSSAIDRALAAMRAPFVWLLSAQARIQGIGRAWKRS